MVLIDQGEIVALLKALEWSNYATAPSVGRRQPEVFPACPVCGGVKNTGNEFIRDYFPSAGWIGHREGCGLRSVLLQLKKTLPQGAD